MRITLTWFRGFKLIILNSVNIINFIKNMNKKQIITKSEQIVYKSVKILFNTIRVLSMIVAMTVRQVNNLVLSWCNEVEEILFIQESIRDRS